MAKILTYFFVWQFPWNLKAPIKYSFNLPFMFLAYSGEAQGHPVEKIEISDLSLNT